MAIARSKLSAQGRTSVSAAVCGKIALSPDTTIASDERNEAIIVRRVGDHSFTEVHQALFDASTPAKPAAKLSALSTRYGIKKHMLFKHPI